MQGPTKLESGIARITDISGREVLSIPVNNRKNISIDLSTLNSGHYLVIIGKTVKQIIKK